MELKDGELNKREEKITGKIKDLFHKPIFVSKDDMDRIEGQERKKITPI